MNPIDSFVIALARASRRASYHWRGLSVDERDDVIATAVAWCWENKAKYDPQYTLEEWVNLAMRDARQRVRGRGSKQKRDPVIGAREFNEMMSKILPDDVPDSYERQQSMRALLRQLLPEERTEVQGVMEGDGARLSDHLRAKLQHPKFRDLLPERGIERIKILRAIAPESDSITEDEPQSEIDERIAELTAMPQHGQDCPPCIHCDWWEFRYAPKKVYADVQDAEVKAAMAAILERKIEISSKVQQEN